MTVLPHLRAGLKASYYDPEVLPAWVAEMDFGLAPPIAEALHLAVDRGLTGYPYPAAERAAAQAAVDFQQRMAGWEVSVDWVFPAPDVIVGCRRAVTLLTRPGSPVIVHSPVYFPFYGMIEDAGRDVIEVVCSPDDQGRYRLNLEAIDRAFDEGAGAIVLCSPWNPTGRSFELEELEAVISIARAHQARVIADEIHAPFGYGDSSHVPAATVDPETVITVTSASKAWNLPGLKCAQVILTNSKDRRAWSGHFTPDRVGVGTFGLIATEAAYGRGGEWFEETMRLLAANRDLLVTHIAEHMPEVVWHPPEATYLAWLDFSRYGIPDPSEFLLREARVALTGGGPFGTGADQYARLNFACEQGKLVEICSRIGESLQRHG